MPSKASLALVVCLAYGCAVMSLPVLETRSHHHTGGIAAVVTQTTTTTTTVTSAVAVDDKHYHHHKNGTIVVDSTQQDTPSDSSADAGTPDDSTLTRRGHGHKKHKHKNHHNKKKNHNKTKATAAVAVVGAGGAGAVLAADAASSTATDPNAANPAVAGVDVQGEPSTPTTPESDKLNITPASGAETAPTQSPVDTSTVTPPALETRGWFYDFFHPKPRQRHVANGAKLSNNDANQRTQFTSGVQVSERGYFDYDLDLW